jgi:hypothetical protein
MPEFETRNLQSVALSLNGLCYPNFALFVGLRKSLRVNRHRIYMRNPADMVTCGFYCIVTCCCGVQVR